MPAALRLRPIARSAGPPERWLSTSDSGESPPRRRSWCRIATSSPSAACRLSRVAYGSSVAAHLARAWGPRLSDVGAVRAQLGDADLAARLRPRVVDGVHQPQP